MNANDNWGYASAGDMRRWNDLSLHFRAALVSDRYAAHPRDTMADIRRYVVEHQYLPDRWITRDGACDANDLTFASVDHRCDTVGSIVIWQHNSSKDSVPVVHIGFAQGLPIIPNGGDIRIEWDNGPFRIFKPGPNGEMRQHSSYARTIEPLGFSY